jgi:hypothetical protein
MLLSYRGSTYNVAPSGSHSNTFDLPVTGSYRGLPVRFKASLGMTEPQAITRLAYRGAEYIRIH